MAGFGQVRSDVFDRVSRSQYFRDNLAGLTAHQRHQRLLAELNRGGQQQGVDPAAAALASTVTDEDVLRQHHRFLRTAEDDEQDDPNSWGVRLAKRYYARLFKEYAIADLSRYKESKIGMRWRTKPEVESGKGQFLCGAKGCSESVGLASYEVNFSYVEAGLPKQALVKLRLCEECAGKLNYKKEKQYKKLSQAVAEQQGQEERHGHDKHKHHKHRRKGRDRDEDGEKEEGEQQRPEQHSLNSSKRRRRSGERSGYGHEGDRQVDGSRAAAGDDSIGDADIDKWLDAMFAAT